MIEIYKTNPERKLIAVDEIVKGSWVNVVAPTESEISDICMKLNIPEDFLKDPLDDEERPRIEREDGHLLIIVDFPYIAHDEAGFRGAAASLSGARLIPLTRP